MWTATASIATIASPRALWRLFEDAAGWTNWNAGIALHGPFASGSTFAMQPPGIGAFANTLRGVRPDVGFVDQTLLDGTRFLVSHELQPLPAGGTRVTYAIKVEGPDAETLGPLVTAHFPEVLAALKALAEQAEHPEHACEGAS